MPAAAESSTAPNTNRIDSIAARAPAERAAAPRPAACPAKGAPTPQEAEQQEADERALMRFQDTITRIISKQRATRAIFLAAGALLARPAFTAVAATPSVKVLRIPQHAFDAALQLMMTHQDVPKCALGPRVTAPLDTLCRLLSAPPPQRGVRTTARALTTLAFHSWLMRFPVHLQMLLVAHAELRVFRRDELMFRQVRRLHCIRKCTGRAVMDSVTLVGITQHQDTSISSQQAAGPRTGRQGAAAHSHP